MPVNPLYAGGEFGQPYPVTSQIQVYDAGFNGPILRCSTVRPRAFDTRDGSDGLANRSRLLGIQAVSRWLARVKRGLLERGSAFDSISGRVSESELRASQTRLESSPMN